MFALSFVLERNDPRASGSVSVHWRCDAVCITPT